MRKFFKIWSAFGDIILLAELWPQVKIILEKQVKPALEDDLKKQLENPAVMTFYETLKSLLDKF